MIDKSLFVECIKKHLTQNKKLIQLAELGFDIWDTQVNEFGWQMFDVFIKSNFNEDGQDWINWWLYERIGFIDGKEHPYYDENNNAHYLHTAEDLWNFINKLTK